MGRECRLPDGTTALHQAAGAQFEKTYEKADGRGGAARESKKIIPPAERPIIRTHPETGRKALYVTRLMTEEITGLAAEESRALLDDLFAMTERDEFHYTHEWLPGDLLIWDNRGAQHARTDYPLEEHRLLRRVGIQGDKPF